MTEEPIDAIAVWVPGLNSRRCRAVITTLPRATARKIAADIAVAPAFPRGPISCPAADNTRVDLYFRYPHVRGSELADIGLSGCASIGAPHRAPRTLPDRIRAALHEMAPPPWKRYAAS